MKFSTRNLGAEDTGQVNSKGVRIEHHRIIDILICISYKYIQARSLSRCPPVHSKQVVSSIDSSILILQARCQEAPGKGASAVLERKQSVDSSLRDRELAKVLVFLHVMSWGGAEKQAILLAKSLRKSGHEIELWALKSAGNCEGLSESIGDDGILVKVFDLDPPIEWGFGTLSRPWRIPIRLYRGWYQGIRVAKRVLPRSDFDVLVPFGFHPSLLCSVLHKHLGGGRLFWNHRGGYDSAGIWYGRFLKRQIAARAPCFVANSTAGAKFLEDTFNLHGKEVTIVRNAFTAQWGIESFAHRDSVSAPIRLVQVANMYPEKDIETLVLAMTELRERGIIASLDVAGYFPSQDRARSVADLIESNRLRDRIRMRGAMTPGMVGELLANSDIGVLSTRSEGTPNAVLEYMYARLPVVASDISGIRDVVGPDNGRWLFPAGSHKALADRVAELAGRPELRAAVGLVNQKRVLATYSIERAMSEWSELLGIRIDI